MFCVSILGEGWRGTEKEHSVVIELNGKEGERRQTLAGLVDWDTEHDLWMCGGSIEKERRRQKGRTKVVSTQDSVHCPCGLATTCDEFPSFLWSGVLRPFPLFQVDIQNFCISISIQREKEQGSRYSHVEGIRDHLISGNNVGVDNHIGRI